MTGFYILKKNVINSAHGWVHIYDTDYGAPTYVGDMCTGEFTNSIIPPGKQLVSSLILGSFEATPFGIPVQMEKVREAHQRWKDAMEKAFPGFNEAIEYEGMNLQLNFTRYAYAVVSTEIDIQAPNIEGLYFGGDSIRSVGTPMSDKCFQLAFPLCERITKYRRSTKAFSSNSKMGDILNDEKGKDILEKHIPGISKDPRTAMGKGMTLKQIAAFIPGQLSPALLHAIDAELKLM